MKNKNGFSFLEMIVTIAIISIMTAVFFSSLSGNKELKAVEGEARKVAAAIREAQNYALTGKKITGIAVCGWGMHYVAATKIYAVYYNFDNIGNGCEAFNGIKSNKVYDDTKFSVAYNSYKLENKVRFNNTATYNQNIYFTIPFGIAHEYDGDALPDAVGVGYTGQALIESEINPSAINYSICIYSSGQVKEIKSDADPSNDCQ